MFRQILLMSSFYIIFNMLLLSKLEEQEPRTNTLFLHWITQFEIHPQTHRLKRLGPIGDFEGYKFYSAYGVFFPRNFSIESHVDYQCFLCNGDFKAIMIPKMLHSRMAQSLEWGELPLLKPHNQSDCTVSKIEMNKSEWMFGEEK